MQTVLQERECSNNVEFFSAKSFNDFFERGFCIGLLSSIIFNRKAWLDVDREEYLPGWSYYEIALKMIARSTLPLAHIRFPMIATLESCDWVKNGTEFFYFINWKNILERLPNFGYNVGYVNLCLSKFPKKLIIILLRAKGNGLKTTKNNLFRLCKEFYKSPFYLVLALIIFIIPNFIIKSVRDIRKKINDIKI
ncbi:MAG: hypothetical protein US58_C0014G0023 [Candidatus Magasanikbacteria bacterium GW2011_GWA2_37_8]|uniref:Uncharacterized protein n=1 Tax=Candidatus Magasanikbacteria bacterium GW2011_GWA2_37_8 TaxID=1619036 RepID=A0A0G0KJA9_9BACT|nr:MAG: hypothetical protein US58_C0014G0023 [Candidatus Magasanikbacteria bacterium GW2011_GWA2_37_8]